MNLARHKPSGQEFWALRDVTFDVAPGRSLGLIGNNGSGKSTALKLISGILEPTLGRMEVKGRVSALLELGAGFHPDLTGRENVFLSGTILGMRQQEMRRRFDEIVAFSEMERFIDTPVKHYSSGMYMRLAFAVAISVEPDLLLVDEVLAVGDASFQKKCLQKIRGFQKAGMTIIMVSHDLATVAEICSSVLWLAGGKVMLEGSADQVVGEYLEFTSQNSTVVVSAGNQGGSAILDADHPVRITKVELLSREGIPRSFFKTDEALVISIRYRSRTPTRAAFGVTVARSDGTYCYATNTSSDGLGEWELEEEGEVRLYFDPLTLLPGTFFIHVSIVEPTTHARLDYREQAAMFKVHSDRTDYGICLLPHRWSRVDAAESAEESTSSPTPLEPKRFL